MPESETLVVYRILGMLAKARSHGRALPLDAIAEAAPLRRPHADHFMNVLEHARVVRAEMGPKAPLGYRITQYGLERLSGTCTRSRV
jgi:DNA-binding IscR family transcriptional regulator